MPMPKLIILGTSNAIADPEHENSHMALVEENGVVLVDCVGTPVVRLAEAGITLDSIGDLILTHFHPDHVSGVPLLLMNMWLLGRQKPLRIYGLHHCLERLEDMMGFYHWEDWPNFFPVAFHRLPERESILVVETGEFRILSSPVRHIIPTIGLRFERVDGQSAIAYSSDTEPCPEVVRLAGGVDVLIHEVSGAGVGHSTPEQAGEVARKAEAGRLLLIHYPCGSPELASYVERASHTFHGGVALAEDFMEIDL